MLGRTVQLVPGPRGHDLEFALAVWVYAGLANMMVTTVLTTIVIDGGHHHDDEDSTLNILMIAIICISIMSRTHPSPLLLL